MQRGVETNQMNDTFLSMEDKYKKWISAYQERVGDVTRKCKSATLEMQESFPCLIRKRGTVLIPFSNRRPVHWWLEAPNGDIIDPTESQFGCILEYFERDETQPEPIGKCLECGADIYPGAPSGNTCSIECNERFSESLKLQ